jgi:nucleoside-diphosphate-sugar epimerase
MNVLFIGGTGVISSACANLVVEREIELYYLNRGNSSAIRNVPVQVRQPTVDVRNFVQASKALGDLSFDVVLGWILFISENIENNLRYLKSRTDQYLFISSASAYQTPPLKLTIDLQY